MELQQQKISNGVNNLKAVEWILRIGVAGEFLGHGVFAVQGKKQWIGWISGMTGAGADSAATLLFLVGAMDILAGVIVLVRPIRIGLTSTITATRMSIAPTRKRRVAALSAPAPVIPLIHPI